MKWYIPDCFWNSQSNGASLSHEAICILNPGREDTAVTLSLYFEQREKLAGFAVAVPAERTIHIRMDRLRNKDGVPVPTDTPYAAVVECAQKIYIQYTRVDSSQPALAIATTMIG
ncbi:MAG: sensory rhodopsin transducer [Acetanaerobacterium sp.]